MSGVRVTIAAPLLAGMLRLPAHIEVIGADAEYDADGSLRTIGVDLDVPDAPAGAVIMEPVYTRASGWPDPLTLTGVHWLDADGKEITWPSGPFSPTLPVPAGPHAPRPEPRRWQYHVGGTCGQPNEDGTCGCPSAEPQS